MSSFDGRRYLIPFRSSLLPQIFCDTLIIGTGVAGLRAAITAAEHGDVIILGKDDWQTSNTAWAQGGIAAVMDRDDTFESHARDTLSAGAGLCDEPVVRAVVQAAPRHMRQLIEWGMRFDDDGSGHFRLGREGGHLAARILHSEGDATGRELARTLWEKARSLPSVRVFARCFALDLITPSPEPGSPCLGAITHHPRYGLQMIWARATILATGGAGMVYRETTNPRSATGDGVAMAFRAGAAVADMAFVQFHPTTLYLAGAARSLITEAVRGQGAYLVDHDGYRFMQPEHPLAELAPRDVVTRAIVRRLASRGGTHVFLDARHIPDFDRQFPGITALLAKFNLNPARDLIPVHPAAHYLVGGVLTDDCARTTVPGLFAVGEVACTGLHGANRLASNSLLEGLVFGEIAALTARHRLPSARHDPAPAEHPLTNGSRHAPAPPGWELPPRPAPVHIVSDIPPSDRGELDREDVISSLRSCMWRNCGIERSGARLRDTIDMIEFWARYTLDKVFDDVEGWQLQNMLQTAWLMARSAHWREESRGCHWRTDFPAPAEHFRVHDVWVRGHATPQTRPVRTTDHAAAAP
jgi:L-aspartate oxidase